MARARVHFAFLNLGHFFDHLLLLVFATVAALTLTREWDMTYAELIPYATPALIAFGLCAFKTCCACAYQHRHVHVCLFVEELLLKKMSDCAQSPLK